MTEQTTRLVMVEDDPSYTRSIATLMHHTPGFELVESFGNPRRLLETVSRELDRGQAPSWQLVLMDLELPGMSGIEATRRLKEMLPDTNVVILTSFEEPSTILQAICVGADGYLLKKAPARELISHLRAVTRGGSPLSGEVARSVLAVVRRFGATTESSDATEPAEPKRLTLTTREQDVLRCLSRGLTYDQVAAELGISSDTIRHHIRNIYKKLQVHSAAEAVSRAVREGLI